ncbi:MAG: redoxin domain-containing protein [Thermoanaerobaculia bacterium]
MGQLIHLQELETSFLAGVPILAISPDSPEKTRELIEDVRRTKHVRLTHRFLSDEHLAVIDAYGVRNTKGAATVRPAMILLDRAGRELWRFTERKVQMSPTDAELSAAVRLLKHRAHVR